MAATREIVAIALRVKPDLVTLVPERRRELTTEGGLNVSAKRASLSGVVVRFHRGSIPVSLFVDPVDEQIRASHAVGADIVELHTGEYADATSAASRRRQLQRIRRAARLADSLGLLVHAGHGLDYGNTLPIASLPEIRELSIGFAIISQALMVGLSQAVREMVQIVRHSRRR
jgi:pyridoxine 5-phosphate synthase